MASKKQPRRVLSDGDIERIRKELDEATPDLPPLSEHYKKNPLPMPAGGLGLWVDVSKIKRPPLRRVK